MEQIKTITGKNKLFFGVRHEDNARIYITKPEFTCDCYWSWGYLGNVNEHYHLKNFQESGGKTRHLNMYDCLADYELRPSIKENLWLFCELASSIYILKDSAELFHGGGSHYTVNPDKEILKDLYLYEKLTFELIPSQCQKVWDLIGETA